MRSEPFVHTGLRVLAMDERNARIAAESRKRPLHDVLADSRQVSIRSSPWCGRARTTY